uniref:Uncharacterized protein n=1 Tax=viral metagenome TaxID=1070528 RepID=A0A6M3JM59_9ZZZZ
MKINFGCHRLVFIFKRIVIKFPNFYYAIMHKPHLYYLSWTLKGIKGNIQESKLFKLNNCYYPILFSFPLGLFIIMKRADELKDSEIDLEKFMKEKNITVENKMDSFGLLNNKIVCIDYENQ